MRKKGKIVSIVLSVVMLMQIFAITSFAAQAPTNVHWAKDGDPDKFSDTELVFGLVDGVEDYKITLYKNGEKIYHDITGYSSNTGVIYEDLIDVIEENGPGSYTATVGTIVTDQEYSYFEDIHALATSEMSDVLVWNGEAKKENSTSNTSSSSSSSKNNTTTQKEIETVSTYDTETGTTIVNITDIYNNELFEVIEEQEYPDKSSNSIAPAYSYRSLISNQYSPTGLDREKYKYGVIYKFGSESGSGTNCFHDVNNNPIALRASTTGYRLRVIYPIEFYKGYCLPALGTGEAIYNYVDKIYYKLPEGAYITNFDQGDVSADIGYVYERKESGWSVEQQKVLYETTKVYKVKLKKQAMVTVNYTTQYGTSVIHFDQNPVIENGRTLVPLRAIFERIGADVQWDGATQTVKATKGDTSISLTINNTTAYKNGQPITLDVPAKILNGRTLVPIRFVADCFGVDVDWVQETQTVLLTAK